MISNIGWTVALIAFWAVMLVLIWFGVNWAIMSGANLMAR